MKAISLYEPWATLIALGEKRFETRSWKTDYRGPLVICASLKKPPLHEIIGILYKARISSYELRPGRALCLVDLVAVCPTDGLAFWTGGEKERAFGDFSPGRFAWKLENVRRFENPPPIKGKQGLFDVDDELIKSLDTYEPI